MYKMPNLIIYEIRILNKHISWNILVFNTKVVIVFDS